MVSLTEMGVMVGIVLGLFGSVFSVVQFFYGRKKDRLQSEREKLLLEEQLKREDRLLKEREDREKSLLAEQLKREESLLERQLKREERKDRMEDMKLIFLDKDIPRKTREPFFEEFVRLGGNGLYARMWLEEGAKLGE